MALVFLSGFETGDFGEWSSTTGSPAVVGTQKKTGDYAMQCDTTGGAATAYVTAHSGETQRGTFYLRIATAPSALCRIFGGIGGGDLNIRLDTDRHIDLYNSNDASRLGTTELALNTWYRISFGIDGSYKGTVYLNGVVEHSPAIISNTEPYLGILDSVTADLYFDDYSSDNTVSSDDPGDIRVLRSSPNAAGQYAEFDTISGYGNCDEVPADGATTIVDDSGVSAMHRETYNLQDWDTIGGAGDDTIKAVCIWVQASDSGNTAQGITVRDDGTDYETMLEFGKAYTWKNKLYDTNAPRASAWTPAIFTAFQAGGYSEGSKDVYMSCVMVMGAYTPAAPAGWTHKYLGVANASIGKISGVAIASIVKVDGVA